MLIVVLPVPLGLIFGLVVALRNRNVPDYRPSLAVTLMLVLLAAASVVLVASGAYFAHLASEPRYRAGNEWADLSFAFAIGELVYGVVVLALSLTILLVRQHRRSA